MKQVMTISKDTVIKGELRSKGKLKIEGKVEGSGLVEGTVLVARQGQWQGNLVADIVIIEGTVKGNIVAKQKFLMLSHAKVDGTVYSSNIHMDEGASITGKLQMKTPAPLGLQIDPANYVPVEEIMSDNNNQKRKEQQGMQALPQQVLEQDAASKITPVPYKENTNVVVL